MQAVETVAVAITVAADLAGALLLSRLLPAQARDGADEAVIGAFALANPLDLLGPLNLLSLLDLLNLQNVIPTAEDARAAVAMMK